MGFLDNLTGQQDEEEDDEMAPLDHYELMYARNGQHYKQAKVDTDLDADLTDIPKERPPSADGVKETAKVEGWPAGHYALKERREDNTYGGIRWNFELEPEEGAGERQLTDEERREKLLEEVLLELRDGGGGGISSPDDAYGRVFEAMMSGEEMDLEAVGALRSFLKEWQATTQDPPNSPGEFAGRIAQQRFEAGDTEGAVSLLDGWFQAEQPGETGGLLASALEGDVELDGSVGLLELAGLDAYTRMEPALDRIATSVGDQAADAVAGGEPDNILTQALAEGSRRREEDVAEPAEPAQDVEEVEQPADVDESGPSRSPGDVAELSEGFGGPKPEAPADDAPAAPATASAGPSEPEITPDDAEQLADDVAAAVGGSD